MSDETELDIAEPEDFLVTRNEDDELQPVVQKLPGVEQHVEVVPLTIGEVEEYGLNDDSVELSDAEVAEIINEHWYTLRESENELQPDNVDEQLIGFGKDALVQAILRASGYDLQNGMAMEQFEQLAELEEGKFERVMELVQRQQE